MNENITRLLKSIQEIELKSLNPIEPIWIYGAGSFGVDIAKLLVNKNYNVSGFIDIHKKWEKCLNLPVIGLEAAINIRIKKQIIIGVFNRSTPFSEILKCVESLHFNQLFMPWDIYTLFEHELGWRFWLGNKKNVSNNIEEINSAYELLSDFTSKETFLSILAFRFGLNNNYSKFTHQENQYFNSLTLPNFEKNEIHFIDGGAYNGDTFLELDKLMDVKNAYLFEPDFNNYLALTKAVENHKINNNKNIICSPLGLTDKYQILSFNAGNGEGGSISENNQGNIHIATTSIDNFIVSESINFIKLDIEGSESLALIGASSTIRKNKPTLAISLYHKPQDLWILINQINSICQDYSFSIRQHFYNSFDSVLYATPKR